MQTSNKTKVTIGLRWVAVLPAAILGCVVARVLIVLLNRITMAGYVDPDSLLARVFIEWMGSLIMGAAAVYIGWYVAPAYKLHTAITLAGIVLLVSGAVLFAALMQRDYWAIFATVAMNVGSIATAYGAAVRRCKLRADDDALHVPFSTASAAYGAVDQVIQSYSTRANHRNDILMGRRKTEDIYDPADFSPYTEAELEAHTVAMENLTAAFDALSATFNELKPTGDLYVSAAVLYSATCGAYSYSADSYCLAASCAMTTALRGSLQAVRDSFQTVLLTDEANNAAASDVVATKAKAAAFKAKVMENAIMSKQLEQKARIAETKAKMFQAKAEATTAEANKALATGQ